MCNYVSMQFPVIKGINNEKLLTYTEMLPSPELSDSIYCYWQCNSKYDFKANIIPDGCVNVIFDLNNRNNVKVLGQVNRPQYFAVNESANLFGIRFLPGKFSTLLNIPADSITNKMLPLKDIFIDFNKFDDEHLLSEDISSFKSSLEQQIISYNTYSLAINRNNNIMKSIEYIYQKNGHVLISHLAELSNCSIKTLLRKYEHIVGLNPKLFCRIVRFQFTLLSINSDDNLNWTEVALRNGYYDQSHFIKDFKEFYGASPSIIDI